MTHLIANRGQLVRDQFVAVSCRGPACECAVKIVAQRQTFPDVTEAIEAHGWRDTEKGVKENRCK